jgi:Leucine-rich repeat (LRR) protein
LIKLFSILAAAFAVSEALIFDCTYSSSSFSFANSVYTCQARVLIFSHNDSVLYAVTQNHLWDNSNQNVTALQIVNERLPSFPRNIESFYSNLKVIFFRNNSLTQISSDDLLPFPELIHLTLWDNKIQTLEDDLFSRTPNLQHIDFDNNQLLHVGRNTLEHLPNLTNAFFTNNVCISKSVSAQSSIASLKYELSTKCPPTLEMFLADVLNREYFREKVNEIVSNKTASLVDRVDLLERIVGNSTSV